MFIGNELSMHEFVASKRLRRNVSFSKAVEKFLSLEMDEIKLTTIFLPIHIFLREFCKASFPKFVQFDAP